MGKECLAFGIIECVEAGAQPLQPDSQNNIGCGNTGAGCSGSEPNYALLCAFPLASNLTLCMLLQARAT